MTQAIQKSRKFLHIDMDCFFASVEMRDFPKLKKIPLGIGGSPEKRGVLATCNYPARKFGLHSAMATSLAFKKCPQLKLMSGDFQKYQEASREIMEILSSYQLPIEVCSLDEAYIDATNLEGFHSSATLLAQDIIKKISIKTKLPCSIGVAPNKFLAKIASDWDKPNGLFTISPKQINDFIKSVPIEKLPGVGPKSQQKLHSLSVKNCQDLQAINKEKLAPLFHSFSDRLIDLSHGRDDRELSLDRKRKSLSYEQTFPKDLQDIDSIFHHFEIVKNGFLRRFNKWVKCHMEAKEHIVKSIFIKLKYSNFEISNSAKSISNLNCLLEGDKSLSSKVQPTLKELIIRAYQKRQLPVRLLGMGVKFDNCQQTYQQLSLFDSK